MPLHPGARQPAGKGIDHRIPRNRIRSEEGRPSNRLAAVPPYPLTEACAPAAPPQVSHLQVVDQNLEGGTDQENVGVKEAVMARAEGDAIPHLIGASFLADG